MATYYYKDVVAKLLKRIESLEAIIFDENIKGFSSKLKGFKNKLGDLNLLANKGNAQNDGVIQQATAELGFVERDMDNALAAAGKESMKLVNAVNNAVDDKRIDLDNAKKILEKNIEFTGLKSNGTGLVHENQHRRNK